VLAAIDFDDDLQVRAVEIENVWSELVLPTKIDVSYLPIANQLPQEMFCISRIATEHAGAIK
jgi:hypothetical protein